MDWYAIQLITGKESQVLAALGDFGVETINPFKPLFMKHGGKLTLIHKPLLPGYLIARLQDIDFYRYQRNERVEKMMIRICGNGYDAVPLTENEISFFKSCCTGLRPLVIKKELSRGYYSFPDFPSWVKDAYIDWYDEDRFRAKVHISMDGRLTFNSFTIAAWSVDYTGAYLEQLQDLSNKEHGQFEFLKRQVIMERKDWSEA